MDIIDIKTNKREEFIDITGIIDTYVRNNRLDNCILLIYSPHTTCGLTINEHADPDVKNDMIRKLKELIPKNDEYKHIEGNSDAHIKTSIIGNRITVIVENGSVKLGRWQGIFLTEFDGPRNRKIWLNPMMTR